MYYALSKPQQNSWQLSHFPTLYKSLNTKTICEPEKALLFEQ